MSRQVRRFIGRFAPPEAAPEPEKVEPTPEPKPTPTAPAPTGLSYGKGPFDAAFYKQLQALIAADTKSKAAEQVKPSEKLQWSNDSGALNGSWPKFELDPASKVQDPGYLSSYTCGKSAFAKQYTDAWKYGAAADFPKSESLMIMSGQRAVLKVASEPYTVFSLHDYEVRQVAANYYELLAERLECSELDLEEFSRPMSGYWWPNARFTTPSGIICFDEVAPKTYLHVVTDPMTRRVSVLNPVFSVYWPKGH